MRGRVVKFFSYLGAAFGFLTIIPGFGSIRLETGELGKSSSFFPVVGLVMGMGLYLIGIIPGLSPFLLAVISMLFLLGMTRGLHTDGVIDTFDGFLSGRREHDEIRNIMKDSRVGALGWMGAFSLYVLKIALFYEIFLRLSPGLHSLLILPPVLSRGGVAFYAFVFPPAGSKSSLGRNFIRGVGLREVLVSTLLMLLFSFRPSVPIAALLPAGLLLFWLGWGYLCRAKIGGITGDTMGAGIEFSETLCLLLLLIVR